MCLLTRITTCKSILYPDEDDDNDGIPDNQGKGYMSYSRNQTILTIQLYNGGVNKWNVKLCLPVLPTVYSKYSFCNCQAITLGFKITCVTQPLEKA